MRMFYGFLGKHGNHCKWNANICANCVLIFKYQPVHICQQLIFSFASFLLFLSFNSDKLELFESNTVSKRYWNNFCFLFVIFLANEWKLFFAKEPHWLISMYFLWAKPASSICNDFIKAAIAEEEWELWLHWRRYALSSTVCKSQVSSFNCCNEFNWTNYAK